MRTEPVATAVTAQIITSCELVETGMAGWELKISTDTKYDFCPLLEIFDLKYQNIVVYQILEEGEGHG